MSARKIVLPADAFDTLEFSALVYEGIGAYNNYDRSRNPYCLAGHVAGAQVDDYAPLWALVSMAGLSVEANDIAVATINRRAGHNRSSRVSWEEYTRELNIVRGA